jgi:hypothetical protein
MYCRFTRNVMLLIVWNVKLFSEEYKSKAIPSQALRVPAG